jgi:peptidoglycan/xylan/chitin deacetylase (PgdA/CDA1 family)
MSGAWILGLLLFVLLVFLVVQFGLLIPAPKNALPVLMYHKISLTEADGLTVKQTEFESHLSYLHAQGYTTISFSDLSEILKHSEACPAKPVIITFDDGYQNNYDLAFPLLKRYNFKATVFLPVGYIGKKNVWDAGEEKIMTYETLREMAASGLISFGLHGYTHTNYKRLSPCEMATDVQQCVTTLEANACPYVPVFAYPYGVVPKDNRIREEMKAAFRKAGLRFAVRIKNRLNPLPIADVYDVRRIDITGNDSFGTFKRKLKKGRTKLF